MAPPRIVAILAVVDLVALYLTSGALDSHTYDWGITLAGIASVAVVGFLLVQPAGWMATALSWRPLVALGRRSYSAYLWHQTVFMFLFRHTSTGTWTRPIVGFAVTFLLADLTYRFVERPGIEWARRWTLSRRAPQPALAVPAA